MKLSLESISKYGIERPFSAYTIDYSRTTVGSDQNYLNDMINSELAAFARKNEKIKVSYENKLPLVVEGKDEVLAYARFNEFKSNLREHKLKDFELLEYLKGLFAMALREQCHLHLCLRLRNNFWISKKCIFFGILLNFCYHFIVITEWKDL